MTVKISILVEGATEEAFAPTLREFVKTRIEEKPMPKLDFVPCAGRLPTKDKLRRVVGDLLSGRDPATAVIALTDVYTGTREFSDAMDAKQKMRDWVGEETRFHPHVALYDFEAWLLPYWPDIRALSGSNRSSPGENPEAVNHDNPPARRLMDVFINGSRGKRYIKPRDAGRILRGKDLTVAANACPELKAFLNTVLRLSGGHQLP